MNVSTLAYRGHYIRAHDQLTLHVRDYGPLNDSLPVICLSGLSRSSEDFDPLAKKLAHGAAGRFRRVIALDYRGRGLSEWDRAPDNYSIPIEHSDIICVLDTLNIKKGFFIGTSRGGMHIMLMASLQPERIHAAVINDIGPVIEPEGLTRIQSYIGKLPIPVSWEDAANQLRTLFGNHFTGLSDPEWCLFAEMTFIEKDGAFSTRYDPALMKNLEGQDFTKIPPLWMQFSALYQYPLLVIRGEHSDILSVETLKMMQELHPNCEILTTEGEGHAPLLIQDQYIRTIADFIKNNSD